MGMRDAFEWRCSIYEVPNISIYQPQKAWNCPETGIVPPPACGETPITPEKFPLINPLP